MDLKQLSEQYEEYIIDRRRYYHSCPELSGEEKMTRAQIRADLEELGITDIREMEDCYGMIATIHGGHPGKTIALRTDIDGLKIQEETQLPFASDNGNMHGCGHDAHIAMLLGAARILCSVKEELHGDVRLIIQPAEEVAMGALWMVKEGAMEGVDAIYGAHIWGNFDAPLIDVSAGRRMAGCDLFTIEIEGVSAHGSAPNLGVDAITAAAAVINNIQQYVSRMNDPLNPLVVTIGEIHGGSRFNIIANHVTMEGTVRTFLEDRSAETALRQIVEHTAAAFGAKGRIAYRYMTTPVINRDEQLTRIARNAVVKLYGEAGVGHLETLMGSEDFTHLCPDIPYIFGFVGSRNLDKGITWTNHHEKYTIDEDVLKRGAAVMAQVSVDYLNETAADH